MYMSLVRQQKGHAAKKFKEEEVPWSELYNPVNVRTY